jgi:sugar phosphate isomerase/epimerase
MHQPRRKFIKNVLALPTTATAGLLMSKPIVNHKKVGDNQSCRLLKTSLNAYSFNKSLMDGTTSLDDLLQFCSEAGFQAVDITAYYFKGYPQIPPDEYLYAIKQKAFRLGLDISGTGVRNEFTDPDPKKRKKDVQLVKDWIEAASKLGVPVIRIFAGHLDPPGYSRKEISQWLVEDIRECITHGKKFGVVVAVQNHNGFLKNGDQIVDLMHQVDSKWFGLVLDTGSFREGDAYSQIAQCIPYAVSWQVKETIYSNGQEQKIDLDKLASIIKASCYKGYLPIETLGPGDPKQKVTNFFNMFKKAFYGN